MKSNDIEDYILGLRTPTVEDAYYKQHIPDTPDTKEKILLRNHFGVYPIDYTQDAFRTTMNWLLGTPEVSVYKKYSYIVNNQEQKGENITREFDLHLLHNNKIVIVNVIIWHESQENNKVIFIRILNENDNVKNEMKNNEYILILCSILETHYKNKGYTFILA